MKTIGSFKEDINNSLKEIQENTGKQLETLKEEKNKSLKDMQDNTIKQVKEIKKKKKTVQDLKVELEAKRKTQTEEIQEMEN